MGAQSDFLPSLIPTCLDFSILPYFEQSYNFQHHARSLSYFNFAMKHMMPSTNPIYISFFFFSTRRHTWNDGIGFQVEGKQYPVNPTRELRITAVRGKTYKNTSICLIFWEDSPFSIFFFFFFFNNFNETAKTWNEGHNTSHKIHKTHGKTEKHTWQKKQIRPGMKCIA